MDSNYNILFFKKKKKLQDTLCKVASKIKIQMLQFIGASFVEVMRLVLK